jgi:hypothetical protein
VRSLSYEMLFSFLCFLPRFFVYSNVQKGSPGSQ